MISFFRQNRRGVVGFFLVGMCALLMLPFGMDYFGQGTSGTGKTVLATVGNKDISVGDFDMMLYGVRSRMKEQFGESYPQVAAMINLKQKVLDDMIDEKVLDEFFKKSDLGIGVSHVEAYIRTLPIFKDGVSREKLLGLLKSQGMTESQFENNISKTLLLSQLNDILSLAATVSSSELRDRYKRARQELELSYAKIISKEKIKDISNEEIKKYYESHEKDFMTQKEYEIKQLKFLNKSFLSKVSIQEEDLRDAYKKLQIEDNFSKPYDVAQPELEAIVRSDLAPDITNLIASEFKDKLLGMDKENIILEMSKKASEDSLDFKSLRGNISSLPPNFSEILSAKLAGEITLIEESDGVLVVYLSEVIQPVLKPLDLVVLEIKNILIKQEEAKNNRQAALDIINKAKKDNTKVNYSEVAEIIKNKSLNLIDASGALNKISLPFLVDEQIKGRVLSEVISRGIVSEPLEGVDGSVYVLVLKKIKESNLDYTGEDWNSFVQQEQTIVSNRLTKVLLEKLKNDTKIEINEELLDSIY